MADVFNCEPRDNPLNSRSAHKSDAVDTPKLCRRQRLGALKRVYPPADEHRAVNKAAVQAYVALVREQARHKQNNRANNRAWGVAEQHTTKDSHPKRRAANLAQVSLAPNRAQLQWLKDVLEAARHAKREAKRQEEEKGRRKPAQAAKLKNPGDGVAVAHENAAMEQTPERLAGARPHWRKAQKGQRDRRRVGKRKGRKRLERVGNSAHKAKSYPAWQGALRRRVPNENKTYFEASQERTHDKTHARLNTQRKTLAVMLALWKRKEAYDPKKFLGAV